MMRLLRLLALAPLAFASMLHAAEPLPDKSVYQMNATWQTTAEQPLQLQQLQGKRQVVAMIYTNCHHACPVIVHSMKQLEKQLTEQEQQDIGFVLITFTPDIDSIEVLKAYADKFDLGDNWKLLRGSDSDVRTFANIIGMKYKLMADGSVDHASTLTLLDKNGVMLGTVRGAEEEVPKMLKLLRDAQ